MRRGPIRRGRTLARTLTALALAGLALGAALPTRADAIGELTFLGCFANGGANGCTDAPHSTLTNARSVAVSPDGKSVYVASYDLLAPNGGWITSFTRDRFTGLLAFQGCIANDGANGCADLPRESLRAPSGVTVSPDNKSVYVASAEGDSVTNFKRDTGSGAISFQECISNGGVGGCTDPPQDPLDGADAVAATRDGRSVYVVAGNADSVTHLTRNPSTGAISYQGCVANTNAAGCIDAPQDSLDLPTRIAASPDGNSVYVVALFGSITHLTRTPSNGFIAYQGCIADGGGGIGCIDPPSDSLNNALGVVVSPDNKNVYVGSGASVTSFTRDTSNGFIGFQGCIADGGFHGCIDPPHDSLSGASGIAVSPDGHSLYVVSQAASSVTQLNRNTATGVISYGACIASGGANGCVDPPVDSLDIPYDVAASADGTSAYVASVGNPLTEFRRHAADCGGRPAGIVGTNGADTITGTPGADVIAALGGNDRVSGLGGKDVICGAGGKDKLRGQAGADKLLGGPGADKLRGGPGADKLLGQGGADLLVGGPGKDKLRGGAGRDRVRR